MMEEDVVLLKKARNDAYSQQSIIREDVGRMMERVRELEFMQIHHSKNNAGGEGVINKTESNKQLQYLSLGLGEDKIKGMIEHANAELEKKFNDGLTQFKKQINEQISKMDQMVKDSDERVTNNKQIIDQMNQKLL